MYSYKAFVHRLKIVIHIIAFRYSLGGLAPQGVAFCFAARYYQ